MRVVFMGTPDIAATCLKKLLADAAAGWQALCVAMRRARRVRAAENIAAAIERKFGLR